MNVLAEAKERARAAGRTLVTASRDERRITARFANPSNEVPFDQVRAAIRQTAFCEREVQHAAMLVIALEQMLAPTSPTRRDSPP